MNFALCMIVPYEVFALNWRGRARAAYFCMPVMNISPVAATPRTLAVMVGNSVMTTELAGMKSHPTLSTPEDGALTAAPVVSRYAFTDEKIAARLYLTGRTTEAKDVVRAT